MEICSGIEPQKELLLSVTLSQGEDVGVECVGIATGIPQEFEIYLVVVLTMR